MSDLDRLKEMIVDWLQPLLRSIDYAAFYEAEVVTQNADGSLELKPLDEKVAKKLPPLSKVRIRYGVPGVTAKIKSGGLALVGFANQSPKKAFALIVDSAAIEFISLFDGKRPAARMGDGVSVNFPPVIPFQAVMTPPGTTLVGTLTILTPGVGQIMTGNPKVLE